MRQSRARAFTLVEMPGVSKRAFTLVELLVVIGIIAVLVGILLPAIVAARRQADLVKCAVLLRQLGVACGTHAAEHRGYLPLAGELVANPVFNTSDTMALATALSDVGCQKYSYVACPPWGNMNIIVPLPAALAAPLGFVKRNATEWAEMENILNRDTGVWRAFMCPSTRGTDRPRTNFGAQGDVPAGQVTLVKVTAGGFGYEWSSNTDYGPNEGVFGYHYDKTKLRRLNGNTTWIRRPSQVVLFSDAKGRSSRSGLLPDPWICWTPSLESTGAVTLADVFLKNGQAYDSDSFDMLRHRGKMNIVFADGHVQTVKINAAELRQAYLLSR
jgi:prepilin-type processing-associated H-X9-DG protein/prepilin-type N-terminal cleavage/methylation domain-containing protein